MKSLPCAHPVLSAQQARAFEPTVLLDTDAEWKAMKRAGHGVANAIIRDYAELFPMPQKVRVLALVGKGNNGGDALIACGEILAQFPRATVHLLLTTKSEEMKPLAKRAFDQLEGRVHKHYIAAQSEASSIKSQLTEIAEGQVIDICIDGLLGVSFSAPLRAPLAALIEAVNGFEQIRLRAAVDLPSGRADAVDGLFFTADFTYATGIAKQVLFRGDSGCGRVRYVDLGFFDEAAGVEFDTSEYVLSSKVLAPVQKFRPTTADKRQFGHLFIVGGSAYMPGALLMAVQAAVRSGVGLVTAFAPASVAATLSAQVPEAMWVPWPETASGTLSPRALPLLYERMSLATAVLCGPGMGRDRNTEMIAQDIVKTVAKPVILDADALRQRVIELAPKRKAGAGPVVVTPHMGEYMRIAKLAEADDSNETLMHFCKGYQVMTVLKGPHTRICDGESVLYNIQGGPVLSRGGSGDLLAGLVGGMVAQDGVSTQTAVARGVVLHGMAAQLLARDKGQVMVRTTQLLDYLPNVIRGELV